MVLALITRPWILYMQQMSITPWTLADNLTLINTGESNSDDEDDDVLGTFNIAVEATLEFTNHMGGNHLRAHAQRLLPRATIGSTSGSAHGGPARAPSPSSATAATWAPTPRSAVYRQEPPSTSEPTTHPSSWTTPRGFPYQPRNAGGS